MKKTIIAVLAAGALVLTACGSDSDGSSDASDTTTADSTGDTTADTTADDNGGGSAQDQLTAQLIESLDSAGLEYDADCISDKTHQLTDEDAEAILAAGPTGDPDVSDEANAIGDTLTDCVTLPTGTTAD